MPVCPKTIPMGSSAFLLAGAAVMIAWPISQCGSASVAAVSILNFAERSWLGFLC